MYQMTRGIRLIVLFAALAGALAAAAGSAAAQPGRWEKELAAFAARDTEAPSPAGGVVFVGSSSIRLWDLDKSFPKVKAINRGFGGSQIADSVEHADLLVLRHKPRTIVFYAGDNDIAQGKTPGTVANDFRAFAAKVHAALPGTRIAFIAIKPSLQRWKLIAQVRDANSRIRAFCETDDRLGFVDVDGPMLGWDEKPRPELFVADGLHLSPAGYELWTTLVRPFVEQ